MQISVENSTVELGGSGDGESIKTQSSAPKPSGGSYFLFYPLFRRLREFGSFEKKIVCKVCER